MQFRLFTDPMRAIAAPVLVISAILSLPSTHAAEWTPLFNGKDLSGWTGDPRLWRVEQGILTGETDMEARKVATNTFLIWKGGEPGTFGL